MTKLSRSKIELFTDCPRCFWLDLHGIAKRPPPFPYTINNAIDYLLKQEFDVYRQEGKPHPFMAKNKIDAVPYQSESMNKWRHNFTGVQHHHKATDFLVYGAVDDVWVNKKGELMVVDYKATGANQHKIHESYGRQMSIYQWLLRRNDFSVSSTGYFVFARVNKANGFENAMLSFDIFVESHTGDDSWIEATLKEARSTFDRETPPGANENCIYCQYVANYNKSI